MVDRQLPEDFVPSNQDVICGWARQNYHHAGNSRLRNIIKSNAGEYFRAASKADKSKVISDIIQQLRDESPTGVGLVRVDKKSGRWMTIGDDKAKDKIGHALRKASAKYQDSGKHKSKAAEAKSRLSMRSVSEDNAEPEEGQKLGTPGVHANDVHQSPVALGSYSGMTPSPIQSGHSDHHSNEKEKENAVNGSISGYPDAAPSDPSYPPMPPPWDYHGRPMYPPFYPPHYYGYGYSPYAYHPYGLPPGQPPVHPNSSTDHGDPSGHNFTKE